jgi:WD40 repeat protein
MRHKDKVIDGVFSPDGRLVFTGSQGGEARLWDACTGYPLSEPLLHHGRITCVDFAADGRQCLSIADSDALRLWNVMEAPIPVPSWFPTLVEAVGGKRLNARGEMDSASGELVEVCRRNCSGSAAPDFYGRWACWFLVQRVREAGTSFSP